MDIKEIIAKVKDPLLVGLVCIMATGWYYAAEVKELREQVTLTEEFLMSVNWNQNAVAMLNQFGYHKVKFTPPPPKASPVPAPEDSTGGN